MPRKVAPSLAPQGPCRPSTRSRSPDRLTRAPNFLPQRRQLRSSRSALVSRTTASRCAVIRSAILCPDACCLQPLLWCFPIATCYCFTVVASQHPTFPPCLSAILTSPILRLFFETAAPITIHHTTRQHSALRITSTCWQRIHITQPPIDLVAWQP